MDPDTMDIDADMLRKAIDEMGGLESDLSTEEAVEMTLAVMRGEMQLRHVRGISDEEMEAAYAQGYGMFRAGNLTKAEEIFAFLATLDNGERKHWTALGAVRFNQKNHLGALMAYAQASVLKVDADVLVKVAQCRVGLGDRESAMEALEGAIEYAGDDPGQARTKAQAEALIGLLAKAA